MYTLAVKRDFTAKHYLFGGDWGDENEIHTHYYQVELRLGGSSLNAHGFLVDILEIEELLESLINNYRGSTLNELPEFKGLNPSIEHFCRIFCQHIEKQISAENIFEIEVRLWENNIAWASYRISRK